VVIPAALGTHALASATGFVSTAADLARFMASLSPEAPDTSSSVLSPASRREMTRRQWRDPYGSVERWYGLGTLSASLPGADAAWDSFGHTGGFPGTVSRTVCVPAQGLAVSVLTNAGDGQSHAWLDGVLHILRVHVRHGGPSPQTAPWQGRWWSLGGAFDLLPVGDRVLVASPGLLNPLQDASEVSVLGDAQAGRVPGRITQAGGYASHGEPAQLTLDASGQAKALKLGGSIYKPEAEMAAEMQQRYVTLPTGHQPG
jgi:D-alanyl-D-alanine carboxypeptidase